jgi:glutamate dehydrogenase
MNAILRHNIHQVQADLFVPGGGRPRTLNESNCTEFLNSEGKPTARAIVEGANLYLTPQARQFLETRGVLIVKDSSANKGGVICSSFEVLCSLVLSEAQFLQEKPILVEQILVIIQDKARQEAKLLLTTHQETGEPLTIISDRISEKINHYKDQLLAHLETITLSHDPHDPLVRALLKYAPPLLRTKYQKQLLSEVPDIHKKAVIACHIASTLIYSRGLSWAPSVADILPLIIEDPSIIGD